MVYHLYGGSCWAICIFTYFLQRDHLKTEHHLESLVSRESSFMFNNLVLLAACFTILWGTLFPIISEYVEGAKVTMGAPWYVRVGIPIGVFLLFLTGVGPLLAWRASSFKSLPVFLFGRGGDYSHRRCAHRGRREALGG